MQEVFREQTKKGFDNRVEDKQTEGYEMQSNTGTQAILEKRTHGTAINHIIWFVLTFWWTLGIVNIMYLVFSYYVRKKTIVVRIEGR